MAKKKGNISETNIQALQQKIKEQQGKIDLQQLLIDNCEETLFGKEAPLVNAQRNAIITYEMMIELVKEHYPETVDFLGKISISDIETIFTPEHWRKSGSGSTAFFLQRSRARATTCQRTQTDCIQEELSSFDKKLIREFRRVRLWWPNFSCVKE